MELSTYDIIKKTITTPKSMELYGKLNKLTFEINKNANKTMVRFAVEKIWNVKVDNVRIINIKGKKKIFARRSFVSGGTKKAIVSLKEGHKVELPGYFETVSRSGGGNSEFSEVK